MTAPIKICEIERLRLDIDGEGIRSLVCFSDCPLKCKYCLNKTQMSKPQVALSPEALLDSLRKDDIYFKASSVGGVTFGGGEPALQSEFIQEFRTLCPPDWTIFIETSLNVPLEHIMRLAKVVDYWFIDIKDLNDTIYYKYTESHNEQVKKNLECLISEGLSDKMTVRVPLIPGYNTTGDVDASIVELSHMGITNVERFTYRVNNESEQPPLMGEIPIEPKPPAFMFVIAVLIAITVGVACGILVPDAIMSIIGSLFAGIIVAIVLCILLYKIDWGHTTNVFSKIMEWLSDETDKDRN